MKLKTNSKKALNNVRNYILDNFHPENYDLDDVDTFEEAAKIIWNIFKREHYNPAINNTQEAFIDYLTGLPTIIDARHYYESAVEIAGDLLEESEEERANYKEADAERLISYMIYKVISREA